MEEILRYNRITGIMKERGIDNITLSEYMGVSKQTVSLWRNNRVQPSIPDLYKIAGYFKVDVRELLVPFTYPPGPSLADLHLIEKEKLKAKGKAVKSKKGKAARSKSK